MVSKRSNFLLSRHLAFYCKWGHVWSGQPGEGGGQGLAQGAACGSGRLGTRLSQQGPRQSLSARGEHLCVCEYVRVSTHRGHCPCVSVCMGVGTCACHHWQHLSSPAWGFLGGQPCGFAQLHPVPPVTLCDLGQSLNLPEPENGSHSSPFLRGPGGGVRWLGALGSDLGRACAPCPPPPTALRLCYPQGGASSPSPWPFPHPFPAPRLLPACPPSPRPPLSLAQAPASGSRGQVEPPPRTPLSPLATVHIAPACPPGLLPHPAGPLPPPAGWSRTGPAWERGGLGPLVGTACNRSVLALGPARDRWAIRGGK